MKPSSSYSPNNSFALLLLGRPGSGKTTLACQFPSPFILDCDNNLSGAVRHLAGGKPFFYETVNIDDGNEVPRTERYQRAAQKLTEAANSEEVETLVVDSITTFHEYILDEVRRQKNLSIDDNLRIQDWQSVATLWKQTIIRLRSTGKLIIFTGHTKLEKDELDGSIMHHVLVQGQMKDQMSALFSDCWLAYVETKLSPETRSLVGNYMIRVLQDNKFLDLKNSLGLPNVFEAKVENFLPKLTNA